jgi:hypothetical protein
MLAMYYKYDVGVSAYDLAAMALRSADEAIELDALLADGYSSRGIITAQVGGDIDAAEADFARANELAPNNPNAASWSSMKRSPKSPPYANVRLPPQGQLGLLPRMRSGSSRRPKEGRLRPPSPRLRCCRSSRQRPH